MIARKIWRDKTTGEECKGSGAMHGWWASHPERYEQVTISGGAAVTLPARFEVTTWDHDGSPLGSRPCFETFDDARTHAIAHWEKHSGRLCVSVFDTLGGVVMLRIRPLK